MNGNSVNVTKSSSISKSYKSRVLALVGAVIFSITALTTSVFASYDTTNWETVEASPYVFWCQSAQIDGTLTELEIGTVTSYDFRGYEDLSYLVLSTYMPVYKGCTYQIEFTVKYIYLSRILKGQVTFNKYRPTDVGELGPQYNSAGESYTDLTMLTFSDYEMPENDDNWYGSWVSTKFTFSFSTADGFIDNIENGYQYVNLSQITEPFMNGDYDAFQFVIDDISVRAMFDPGADYFIAKVLEDLDSRGDQLGEVSGQVIESESFLVNKANSIRDSVQSEVDQMMNQAAALISPARSNTSVLTPLQTFGTIFTTFTQSLPPTIQGLLVACPMIMFIAWLIGRIE